MFHFVILFLFELKKKETTYWYSYRKSDVTLLASPKVLHSSSRLGCFFRAETYFRDGKCA